MSPHVRRLTVPAMTFILATIPCALLRAQDDFAWAAHGGGQASDRGKAICTDPSGNVYITGVVEDNAVFGPYALGNGFEDVFVVKYDAEGEVQWARMAGSTANQETGTGICADAEGNIYVTGVIREEAHFGDIVLTSNGITDIFIAKYDTDGNALWAVDIGGANEEIGGSIVMDGNGDLVLTGTVVGEARFGDHILEDTQPGWTDIVVAKYTADGEFVWARRDGGEHWDSGTALGVDADDNILVTGFFSEYAYFDDILLVNPDFGRCPFLAKYDASGEVLWATAPDPIGFAQGTGLAVGADGTAFITGTHWGALDFGTVVLPEQGDGDAYLAHYDVDGDLLWARSTEGDGRELPGAIAVDPAGNIHMCGFFVAPVQFGSYSLTPAGDADAFVVTWTPDGEVMDALQAGGDAQGPLAYPETADGVAVDASGTVYIVGTFKSTATFAPHTITATGGADVFVARLENGTSGVEDASATNGWTFGPNPSNGQVQIRPSHGAANISLIEVYDPTGRIIQRTSLANSGTPTLDLAAEHEGTYLLRVVQDGVSSVKPLVLVR